MCSCSVSFSCGALAIEYDLRLPSVSWIWRYCPALNLARCPAGSRSCNRLTSGASSELRKTLTAKRRLVLGSERCQLDGAMLISLSATHWHKKTPCRGALSLPAPHCTSPARTAPAQLPHTPFLHEYGSSIPAFSAASRIDCPFCAMKQISLFAIRISNDIAGLQSSPATSRRLRSKASGLAVPLPAISIALP